MKQYLLKELESVQWLAAQSGCPRRTKRHEADNHKDWAKDEGEKYTPVNKKLTKRLKSTQTNVNHFYASMHIQLLNSTERQVKI